MAGRFVMDQGGQLGKGPVSQQKDALIITFLVTMRKYLEKSTLDEGFL